MKELLYRFYFALLRALAVLLDFRFAGLFFVLTFYQQERSKEPNDG